MAGILIVGLDVHIGSQITALDPFAEAFARIVALARQLRADGHDIFRVDLGGGLGVAYAKDNVPPPDPAAYGALAARATADLGAALIFEPGRSIAANAGVLVSRVVYVKTGEARTFMVLDAGMNDLVRPALYDAHHDIVSVAEPAPDGRYGRYDVVGPVCESTDVFATNRALPCLKAGDLVAFLGAGAYGAVMASAYNARPPAPEVLVKGGQWSVVRPRLTDDALIAADRIPDWLA
jgi:diaminopimelate decarboxylase